MRQPLRQVVDAGVLAVHRAETVADVAAAVTRQRGELAGERRPLGVVLARLCCFEPQVLEHHDAAELRLLDDRLRGNPSDAVARVVGKANRPTEQLRQSRRRRAQRERRVDAALGPAEVRHHDDASASTRQLADGGDAGLDPLVVGDHRRAVTAGVQRHVEVSPDKHGPAGDLEVVDGAHTLRA